MEGGGEAPSSEAVTTAGSVVLEYRPRDESPKNVDLDSPIAVQGTSNDTELAVSVDSSIPRISTRRSMSSLDSKLDILAEELSDGVHIYLVDPLTPLSSETAPREEKKTESPAVVGSMPLSPPVSPYTSEPREKDVDFDSANYTHVPSARAYFFDTSKEQDEILQSLAPSQSAYGQHQRSMYHPDSGPRSSSASLGSFGHQNIPGNLPYRLLGSSDVSSTDRGSNVQITPYSDRRDSNQPNTERPQHQFQLQAHQRSSSYSHGATGTKDTVGSYVTSRGSDGWFAQQPAHPRRNRRRSRPASDFAPSSSSSALGGFGQTGPAFNRNWQQRQQPATSPYVQQQQQQDFGVGGPGYGFPTNGQQGLDSKMHDLAEEQLLARSSRPSFMPDAYDLPASPGPQTFSPWLSHQSGPLSRPPGLSAQAGGASRSDTRIYPTRDFTEGRVLIIDWAEPRGSVAGAATGIADSSEPTYFHKKRRFVVAMTGPGHSFCLPIFTYANRGCNKNGVKPNQHGIIHAQDIAPTLLKDEPALGYEPITMISDGPETLRRESRINYAKPHTLEHNVKLRFIGHIREDQTASIQRNMFHAMQNHKLSMV